jgi:hypothetical protein
MNNLFHREFLVVIFSSAKCQDDLDLMFFFREAQCLISANIEIVIAYFVGYLERFELRFFCIGSTLGLGLLLFEHEFAIIHDFGKNKSLLEANLDEIHIGICRFGYSLFESHHAEGLSIIGDNSYLSGTNFFIDPSVFYCHSGIYF